MVRPGQMRYGETPALTIVIPTVDVLSERARRCIEEIRATTDGYEIVLVDNHAPPQGYTAPVNAAVNAARGEYIVVMNDDIEVKAGWWPPLKEHLDLGASVALPHTGVSHHPDRVGLSCLAVSRGGLERVGHSPEELFDPRFKVWYQDLDLLLRVLELGRAPEIAAGSHMVHHWGKTVRSEDDELRSWVREQVKLDRRAFAKKWGGGRRGERAQRLLSRLPEGFGDPAYLEALARRSD
jgi:glycosyltransferase involved in cell wall biosynthesis